MNLDRNTIKEKASDISRDYNSVASLLDDNERENLCRVWLNELGLLRGMYELNKLNN